MKHYLVNYYRDFGNTYRLAWVEAGSVMEREALSGDWERITRKEAIRLCVEERSRRINDESFSGYADTEILPLDTTEKENESLFTFRPLLTSKDGYVFDRCR